MIRVRAWIGAYDRTVGYHCDPEHGEHSKTGAEGSHYWMHRKLGEQELDLNMKSLKLILLHRRLREQYHLEKKHRERLWTMTMTSPLDSAGTALYASPEAARHAQGLSLRNSLTSLVISAAIFTTEVCVFVFLKDRLK